MQTPRMAVSLALSPRSLNRALPVLRSAPARARARSAASKCSMASNTVRVGAAQMTSTNDLDANYNTCARLVKEAAAAGVKLLCFPESFSFIGAREGESLKIAEPVDGPIMQRYCSLAREANIWLSLGGFQEKGPDETHLHNTHVLLDDSGNIRSIYRKIHFGLPSAIPQTKCLVEVGKRTLVRTLVPRFDVDVPGNMVYKESAFTAAGDTIVVQDSPVGCLGLTVCYDLRFPELYQQLRFQHHAQVLLVPSAFTKVTGAAHWEILLRARAIETQCYVIAAAQAGKHNDKRESYGDSLIIDPWGTVISRLPDRTSTGIAIAEINLSMIDAVRTRMPISEHRKFNSYWKPASP